MTESILIAGGNSGIGLETVRVLSSQGKNVICASRSEDNLHEFPNVTRVPFEATSGKAPTVECDSLQGLVYFPGSINLKPFQGFSDEDFLGDIEVNLMGAVRLIRANLGALKKADHASVVLFSTVAVQTGLPYHTSIAAAKGAVEGFARALAAELAPKVRVNCIAPSLTDTPLASSLLSTPEKVEASSNRHPLKRVGDPVEVAKTVSFLLGKDSGFITGQVLHIDGGLSTLKGL